MEIKNIDIKFDEFHLMIGKVSLSDQMNLIYGQSGSGKSTFVDVLLGFVNAPRVSWLVKNEDLAQLSTEQKKLGVVLQHGQVFPHLTGMQCLEFVVKSRKVENKKYKDDLSAFCEKLQLTHDKLKQKTATMSGGEKQRLALMCALIGEPKVLILDEAFSSLDGENKLKAIKLVKDFSQERQVPTIIISHDVSKFDFIKNQYQMQKGRLLHNVGTTS